MSVLKLDFETRCDLDITEVGTMKYVMHESFDIVMCGYKLDDHIASVWTPDSVPMFMWEFDVVWAHNSYFDYLVHLRAVELYGFPYIPLERWRDSMALAARYTLPLGLAEAGKVAGLNIQKQVGGKALIKKICCPPYKYTEEDFNKFISYCIDDVESMHELINILPANELSDFEQEVWELTVKMNMRGLPVDLHEAETIHRHVTIFLEMQQENLPELTDGKITKVTQHKRIKDFCHDNGVMIPNTQAPTVLEWLDFELPDNIRELLTLRKEFGSTAIAKYKKLIGYNYEGYIHNNLVYYGAPRTGRWAGRGFQMHNMPRAKVKNPHEHIQKFLNIDDIDNPVKIAKALIRPMIQAPDGYYLIVADYTGIENRNLFWIAHDEATLELLRSGLDQYKDMACFVYGVEYDEVTGDQRWMGKTIVLGCGYQMGADLFQATCKSYGREITKDEALGSVGGYRAKYPAVVKFWKNIYKAAITAVRHPDVAMEHNGIKFKHIKDKVGRRWLVMWLHSGRPMFYMEPEIHDGKFGDELTYMGINPYSKQWSRISSSPGKLTENICQAESRDIMAHGMIQVERHLPEVRLIGTVHDEAIGIVHEKHLTDTICKEFSQHLCKLPSWATGFPLETAGYIAKRYKKD